MRNAMLIVLLLGPAAALRAISVEVLSRRAAIAGAGSALLAAVAPAIAADG